MKIIPKGQLDEIIALTRTYWNGTDADRELLQTRITKAQHLQIDIGVDWLSIIDFIDSIIRHKGFSPNADNYLIYCVLRLLGWEVADDAEHLTD